MKTKEIYSITNIEKKNARIVKRITKIENNDSNREELESSNEMLDK